MTETVVITDHVFPHLDREREVFSSVDAELVHIDAETPAEIVARAADHDPIGLMTTYAPIDEQVLSELSSVEFISAYGIGVDQVDVDAASDRGIPVFHVPDYCIHEVATHTVGLILACERRIPRYDRETRAGGFDWEVGQPIRRLVGRTLGIVGFGRIGRHVADRMDGFGFDIVATDPDVPETVMAEHDVEKVDFETLCDRSDIVTLHTPLTEETQGLIDGEALERMGPDTTLVNAARGPLVDQEALYEALQNDVIGFAALDVLAEEPPEDEPLVGLENAVVTPHAAWYSEDAMAELQTRTAENAAHAVSGEAVEHVVNADAIDRAIVE